MLLDAGASVEYREDTMIERYSLYFAVMRRNTELINLLLLHGANSCFSVYGKPIHEYAKDLELNVDWGIYKKYEKEQEIKQRKRPIRWFRYFIKRNHENTKEFRENNTNKNNLDIGITISGNPYVIDKVIKELK